ncbi:cleavage and polyadenylation specificity factor 73-I [Actinidia rufa]|uniref:Cleavage and polyadenylation specificity factor 73-I n=1 Tax=Actinidia rufa TaxID=165716 RepID=A0A7J0F4M7_9ERIC|nr:cleavage and polyadenylation specificity factor 73-I [Actinidia rufa]
MASASGVTLLAMSLVLPCSWLTLPVSGSSTLETIPVKKIGISELLSFHRGRVLIPAFALGRAQELLLILDEYWSNHPELHNIPIYYASPLAKRCMAVYQTYINAMNERIRNQFANSNPFDFKHISPLKSIENFEDVGPSVVMASPSGLQSGLSRQLFDKWCSDKKNACVIPGYVVEGMLAKTIINEPKEVTLMNGLTAPLNMQVHCISFSAHADYAQTSTFLKELMPPNIILVHGEANEMGRLKQKLITLFADGNTKIISPKNCQSVEMYFNSEKMAKTIGKLGEKVPEIGETVSGLLVKKGFTYQIMAPDDLHVFSQLSTTNVIQRISIPYSGAFGVIKHRLKQIYESVESSVDEESGVPTLRVHDQVTVKQESEKHISVHWNADPISDMVSDSIVALVLNVCREMPKVVVESESEIAEQDNGKKAEKICHALLVSLFGDVKHGENGKLVISVDGDVAHLDKQSGPAIGPKGIAKPRELNLHHQRTSSESFLMDEQPSWLDELLDEPDTPVRKGGHRRSSSDSFAYIDVANASTMDYAGQDDYRFKNMTSVPSWGDNVSIQSPGSSCVPLEADGFPSTATEKQDPVECCPHDPKAASERKDYSPAKSSASESDTKRAKQYVLSFVLLLSILSLLACMS